MAEYTPAQLKSEARRAMLEATCYHCDGAERLRGTTLATSRPRRRFVRWFLVLPIGQEAPCVVGEGLCARGHAVRGSCAI